MSVEYEHIPGESEKYPLLLSPPLGEVMQFR